MLAAADHGYCDGAAHQRKAAFRGSLYDTGVFVLMSKKAAAGPDEQYPPRLPHVSPVNSINEGLIRV